MPRQSHAAKAEALVKARIALEKDLKEAQRLARKETQERRKKQAQIAGEVILAELEQNPESEPAVTLRKLLDARLTRPAHRAMFDLKPAVTAEPAADGTEVGNP